MTTDIIRVEARPLTRIQRPCDNGNLNAATPWATFSKGVLSPSFCAKIDLLNRRRVWLGRAEVIALR